MGAQPTSYKGPSSGPVVSLIDASGWKEASGLSALGINAVGQEASPVTATWPSGGEAGGWLWTES